MARGETKAQKMARLAAQDRDGAALLRSRGVTDHAHALEVRAKSRQISADLALMAEGIAAQRQKIN